MDEAASSFIESKTVAVVGASTSRKKFGNIVYRDLKAKGYDVYAVNPNAGRIEGDVCYPTIQDLPSDVEAAVVVTSPDQAEGIVDDSFARGLKKIWFQQGAESPSAVKRAEDRGLTVVSRKCIMMYAPPVKGFHAFHRFLAKLFKKL